MEIHTDRSGASNVRVALFNGGLCAANTYAISSLRDEDSRYAVAHWLLTHVKLDARSWAVEWISEEIEQRIAHGRI